ncbi:MAG: heme ABC exporter ATP-binding protein CcmA [Rickettsiales bacterium]|nr:MAG: heme ABC exporter ATP-binding protein CcmA [Rickettsiales bacterium]
MLSLQLLGFFIDEKSIFQNISISFLPCSIIHLKGKNGSGKTSLLRMLAGIQSPSSGTITFGKESLPISYLHKPYCTYIGHQLAIKQELTVLQNILYWAKLYDSEMLIGAALSYFQLQDVIDTKCFELSAGNQKKVALARLISCSSKLWLLDEVDTNLDSSNKEILLNLILTHANNGGIVIFASHNDLQFKTAQIINLDDYKE